MNATPVRVLWLISGLARGGAEQLLLAAARRLDPSQVVVEVAYVLAGYDALVPLFEKAGVPVHGLGAKRVGSVGWPRRFRRLVRAGRYDIVHTHSPAPAAVARLLLPTGVKFIHTEHSSWEAHHPATQLANGLTYGRNHGVIAVSHAVAASVRTPRWLRPPIEVVYQGVDASAAPRGREARLAARAALGVDRDAHLIGSVGNFSAVKGHDMLVSAFARLTHTQRDAVLVLIGFGLLEDALRSQVRDAGLDDRVIFTGSREDVRQLLPALDVFVLPSRHEGLGLSMLEAMAAGVPCVAFRVDAIPETLTDGEAGILVDPGDVHGMASAIQTLLEDEQLRAAMGAAGMHVASRFAINPAIERLNEIYQEAARGIAFAAEKQTGSPAGQA